MQYLKKPKTPSAPIAKCEADEEVAANELLCALWDLWQYLLPSETEIELAFPKEYKAALKERIKELKILQTELLQDIRKIRNEQGYWQGAQTNMEHISTIIKRMEWKFKPTSESKGLDIEKAKAVPITNLVNDGMMKTSGGRLITRCPLHQEKHGSFVIYTHSNKWHCFGACGRGGDVIDLYMLMNNVTLKEAITQLS